MSRYNIYIYYASPYGDSGDSHLPQVKLAKLGAFPAPSRASAFGRRHRQWRSAERCTAPKVVLGAPTSNA